MFEDADVLIYFKGRALTVTLCCGGVVLYTLPAGIISAGLTAIDERRREEERLRLPAAKLILAWWRVQSLKSKSRTKFTKDRQKLHCKLFIAQLVYKQHSREFRSNRYGTVNEISAEAKHEFHRISQHLKLIEEKLDICVQRMVE